MAVVVVVVGTAVLYCRRKFKEYQMEQLTLNMKANEDISAKNLDGK